MFWRVTCSRVAGSASPVAVAGGWLISIVLDHLVITV
jgi:hypothetical protein